MRRACVTVLCSIAVVMTVSATTCMTFAAAPAHAAARDTRTALRTGKPPTTQRGTPAQGKRALTRSKRAAIVAPGQAAGDHRRGTSDKKPPRKHCETKGVTFDRNGSEAESIVLLDCSGKPLKKAEWELAMLARPVGTPRPEELDQAAAAEAETIVTKWLNPELVTRLHEVAKSFPGKTISIISGYRPTGASRQHRAASALDLRIGDTDNAALFEACKKLPDTGCGFYPNSSFVHLDARPKGSGRNWIDASGPGEDPVYVTHWPPRDQQGEAAGSGR